MMGPNGAGKTTVFNLITGVYPPKGKSLIKATTSPILGRNRCRLGIGRTYQIPRPFENMTVLENLLVGAEYGANLKGKEAHALSTEILEFTGSPAQERPFRREADAPRPEEARTGQGGFRHSLSSF